MTLKERRDVYQDVTDRIVAALEQGTVPWQRPWVTASPVSLDGRPYRGINVFLLGLAGYSDNRWGTFNAIKRHGGSVRKGEHGTRVILWKPVPAKEREGEEVRGPYLLLRDYVVFSAEQADGLPAYDAPEHEHTPIERAEEIFRGYDGCPPVLFGGDVASYSPFQDIVKMPRPEAFDAPDAYYVTLFHELTHSTGHEKRLKRIEPALFGTSPYAKEELVAEMGAAMLSGLAGIETAGGEQSAAYIAGWLKALNQDKKLVVQAAAQAQKSSDLIVGTTFEDTAVEAEKETVSA